MDSPNTAVNEESNAKENTKIKLIERFMPLVLKNLLGIQCDLMTLDARIKKLERLLADHARAKSDKNVN